MDSSNMIIPSLLKLSEAVEQAINDEQPRIHAIYPRVQPKVRSIMLEDLMAATSMVFIGSGDAYLGLARTLLSFLVMAVDGKQEQFYCPHGQKECYLHYHFGLDHHHLDNFHNWNTVEFYEYYWQGYEAAALAQSQEEAHRETKAILAAHGRYVDELKAGSLLLDSVELYDASFISIAGDSTGVWSSSRQADNKLLTSVSSRIGALIQDHSAHMYTLLGGGSDEVMLYGNIDAYLQLAKGLVDFVTVARNSRPNLPPNKPLINLEMRNLFDTTYSFYPMAAVCLAETEVELEQTLALFRPEP